MLLFVVTVKPAEVTANWAHFSALVRRTITCLTRQTSSAYRVVVVYDTLPDGAVEHPHVDYVRCRRAPANDWATKEHDKAVRLQVGIDHGRRYRPTHYMPVDADDLVSVRLAAFVASRPATPGWVARSGFVWPAGWPLVLCERHDFAGMCGTSLVLGEAVVGEFFRTEPIAFRGALRLPPGSVWFDHQRTTLDSGEPLTALPFPAVTYQVVHGENIRAGSALVRERAGLGSIAGRAAKVLQRPPRPVTPRFRREFGLRG